MQMTGILSINSGESRINGVLLARENEPNSLGEATNFLINHGCNDGESITVTGANGTLGNVKVFFITNVQHAENALATESFTTPNIAKDLIKTSTKKSLKNSGTNKKENTLQPKSQPKSSKEKKPGKTGGNK